MNKIYLIFYKGKGNLLDKIIRFTTNSKYSHCELAIQITDQLFECYSSSPRDNGVRVKKMVLNQDNWDFVEIRNVNFDLLNEIKKLYENTKKMKYDYLGAISTVFKLHNVKNRFFCSEWCGLALKITNYKKLTPHKLYMLYQD